MRIQVAERPEDGAEAAARSLSARIARNVALSAYLPTVCAILTLTLAIGHLGWLFWAATPHSRLIPWLAYMAAVIAAMLAAVPVEATIRPRALHAGFWRRYFAILVCASNLGVAASAWILLPTAGPALQLYMIVLYAWYVIVLLHALRTDDGATFAGIALILASAFGFWATQEVPLRTPVMVFLGLFGLTTMILQQALQTTVRAALSARFEAEDAHARLVQALAEVSAERDAKARFIAAASHDLQQPIQAARLYFDLLSRAKPASRNQALAGGRAAFSAVESLLGDMLQHLRLESGAVQAEPAPVALAGLCDELAVQFRPAAAQAGLSIVASHSQEIAIADRDLLRRALGNLIDNAIKHSGARTLQIRVWSEGDAAVIVSVQDDGRGMSPENVERLLGADTSFRRVAGMSAPGFGLGVPAARRIAGLLGGSLEIASTPGHGCAFDLVLPRASAQIGRCTTPDRELRSA